jgi:hypothetical protein
LAGGDCPYGSPDRASSSIDSIHKVDDADESTARRVIKQGLNIAMLEVRYPMLEEVAIFENLEAGRRISLIRKHSDIVYMYTLVQGIGEKDRS